MTCHSRFIGCAFNVKSGSCRPIAKGFANVLQQEDHHYSTQCCRGGDGRFLPFCTLHLVDRHHFITPLIMTSIVLTRTLQTALLDTHGAAQGVTFETRAGMIPPDTIGFAVLASDGSRSPVYSSDSLGPDLASLPFCGAKIWVQARSVFSKETVLRQVRISDLMAIWDYKGKLESVGWTCAHSFSILRA